ncbi:response regulator transcription factor [Candidatus Magnetaquicoccus inordinatus]|uniref:response regulator transcription factor n=1 Tax=Candidatus Magnetaquicoccus inordinatus TaxID=2496818 RepID=UPI00102CBCDB|nr:response regulator transcription factor [Candidatus Magnetaquicoccus inordinatus]
MNRILLVEDHERLARLICQGLLEQGIASDIASRMDEAREAMAQVPYQAILLDRGLPDGDGLALLQYMRTSGLDIPCLVLTARDALRDRVEGLDAGADDYLPKPFAMSELVARVKALLRRPSECRPLDPQAGDLSLRPSMGALWCGKESVALAPAEMQIMLLLLRHHQEVVRRSMLEAAAWGISEMVTPNALDVAIHRMRRKLLLIGSRQNIVNVRGCGYALRENELDK